MQRLIEHDGPAFGFERTKVLHAFGMFARQESLIAEAVGRQTRQAQRVQHRRRARSAGDGQSTVDGPADNRQTGIVDGGHAGIGDDQHGRALFHLVEQTIGLVTLVMVVVGHHLAGNVDSQTIRKRIQAACVFGRHDVRALHEGDQPRGRVCGVADRRRGEDHRALRNVDVGDQAVKSGFRMPRLPCGVFRGEIRGTILSGNYRSIPSSSCLDDGIFGLLFAHVLHVSQYRPQRAQERPTRHRTAASGCRRTVCSGPATALPASARAQHPFRSNPNNPRCRLGIIRKRIPPHCNPASRFDASLFDIPNAYVQICHPYAPSQTEWAVRW